MTDERTCAHKTCECKVSGEEEYCSKACQTAAKSGADTGCHCGHSGCTH